MRIGLIFLILFVAIAGAYLANNISNISKISKIITTTNDTIYRIINPGQMTEETEEPDLTGNNREAIDAAIEQVEDFKPTKTNLETPQQIEEPTTQEKISTPGPIIAQEEAPFTFLTKTGIILQTNRQREQNNLPPLEENNLLNQMALAKAQDMFQEGYFAHVSPEGVDVAALANQIGYDYLLVGENLALGNFGSDLDVVEAWMGSPGHGENILKPNYAEIGVAAIQGIYNGQTTWIAVQEFGLSKRVCGAPDSTLKAEIEQMDYEINQLALLIQEKEAEIKNISRSNPGQYNQKVNEYNVLVQEYNTKLEELKALVADYNEQVKDYNVCVEEKISFREEIFVLEFKIYEKTI